MNTFNKSAPQEPINPTPGMGGLMTAFNQVLGQSQGAQTPANSSSEYFDSFDPSLATLQKFVGKNVLITGATGGIGS